MASFNEVRLMGRVGQDPTINHFEWGSVASFSVATNRSFKNKAGEWESVVSWHRVKCFNDLAKRTAEKVKKGDTVVVFGELSYNKYKPEGSDREVEYCEIRADKITRVPVEKRTQENNQQQPQTTDENDDLPF